MIRKQFGIHMTDETNSFERYNHINNGGYWFRTYVERNAQYLEIGLSNHGIPSTTTIMLNSHVIDSLREVLDVAHAARVELGLNQSGSYLVDLPNKYRDYENDSEGYAESSSELDDDKEAEDDIVFESQQDYEKFLNDLIEAFTGTKQPDPPKPEPQPEPKQEQAQATKEPKHDPLQEYTDWLNRILSQTEQKQRHESNDYIAKWVENLLPKKVIDPKQQARDFVTSVLNGALNEMDKLNEELHKLNERRKGK